MNENKFQSSLSSLDNQQFSLFISYDDLIREKYKETSSFHEVCTPDHITIKLPETNLHPKFSHSYDPLDVNKIIFHCVLEDWFPECCSRFSKLRELEFSLNFKQIKIFRHDLVAESLFRIDKTDVPLNTIESLGISSDFLTPDVISFEDQTYVVVELKTLNTNVEKTLITSQNLAMLKYYEHLDNRKSANYKIILSTIVVGRSKVRSVIEEEFLPLKAISASMHLGLIFEDYCKKEGIYNFSEDDDVDVQKIKESLTRCSKLPINHEDELIITEDWFNFVKEKANCWTGEQCYKDYERVYNGVAKNRMEQIAAKAKGTLTDLQLSINREEQFWIETDKFPQKDTFQSSIIKLPFVSLKMGNADLVRLLKYWNKVNDKSSLLSSIWQKAVENGAENEEKFQTQTILEQISEASDLRVSFNEMDKRIRNRVKIRTTLDENLYLAETGVKAKKMKKFSEIKETKLHSQKSYSRHSNLLDIDESFNHQNDLEAPFHTAVEELSLLLLEKTEIICNLKDQNSTRLVKSFLSKRIYNIFNLINELVQEVNISRSQFCKQDEFILKKLPSYNCLVLIKPTKINGPIFFSISFTETDLDYKIDEPFSKLEKSGSFYYSRFYSLDNHRISHLLNLPQKMCSLYYFWKQLFEVETNKIEDNCSNQIWNHYWISILIFLEDKEITSRNLSHIRYAYMELTTNNPWHIDPLKITKKLDTVIRSRLQLWIYKRIFGSMQQMIKLNSRKFSKANVNDITTDVVEGFISWVDMSPIKRFEIALNLSYLSILHNKDESNDVSSYLKMFSKIISEELKLRDADLNRMGRSDDSEGLKSHEFSLTHVIGAGITIRQYLKKIDPKVDELITKLVASSLDSKTLLEIATTKSSAEAMVDEPFEVGCEMNKRGKCIGEVIKMIRNLENDGMVIDTHFMRNIDYFIKEAEKVGCIQTNMFKKLQIGGTREIFVLTILSRIVILFVETCCRTLCEVLPGEMLTKGTKKLSKIDEHFANFKHCGKTITITNSSDAQTWCQQFVMKCFGALIISVFPENLSKPMCRVLNLVTLKKLELPSTLLTLFHTHRNVVSMIEEMNVLKDQHLGRTKEHDLIDLNGRYLKNRSNMMQGILHYTSSLVHTGSLMLWKEYATQKVKTFCSVGKFEITHLQSSDDSNVILTCKLDDSQQNLKMMSDILRSKILLAAREESMSFWSARSSYVKSTTSASSGIFEFNSDWHSKNTLLRPIIKHVINPLNVLVQVKMENRLHQASNLRSQLIKSGASILLTAIIDRLQLLSHYCFFGSDLRRELFLEFFKLICKKPHPSFGFYPLEPEKTCGIGSFRFALFNLYENSMDARKIMNTTRAKELDMMEEEDPIIMKVCLFVGQIKKFLNFQKKLNISRQHVIDEVNKNPIVLYKKPQNLRETLIQLEFRATQLQIAESLDFSSSAKFHVTALYLLSAKCVTTTIEFDDKPQKTMKSLFSLVSESIVSVDEKTDDFVKILFPEKTIFDILRTMNDCFGESTFEVSDRQRNKFISIKISRESPIASVSLYDSCKNLWFKDVPKASKRMIEESWLKYTELFPWLNENLELTLQQSPFDTHLGLYSFLKSSGPKIKTIEVTGPVRLNISIAKTIKDIIKNCQWPKEILTLDKDPVMHSNLDLSLKMQQLKTLLWRCLTAPNTEKTRQMFLIKRVFDMVLSSVNFGKNLNDLLLSMTEEDKTLTLISLFYETGKIDIHKLEMLKFGTYGNFVLRQHFDKRLEKYIGNGIWVGKILGRPIRVVMYNEFATRIEVENLFRISSITKEITELISELRLIGSVKPNNGDFYIDLLTKKRCSWKSGSVPVNLVSKIEKVDIFSHRADLALDYGSRLKLIVSMDGRDVTVLALNINKPSVSIDSDFKYISDVPKHDMVAIADWSWVLNKEETPLVAMAIILKYPIWSKGVLRKSLALMGFKEKISEIYTVIAEEQIPTDIEAPLIDMSEDLIQEIFDFENDFELGENYEEVGFSSDDLLGINIDLENDIVEECELLFKEKQTKVSREKLYYSRIFFPLLNKIKTKSRDALMRMAEETYLLDDVPEVVKIGKALNFSVKTDNTLHEEEDSLDMDVI